MSELYPVEGAPAPTPKPSFSPILCPGPWRANFHKKDRVWCVSVKAENGPIYINAFFVYTEETAEADARAISAVPELIAYADFEERYAQHFEEIREGGGNVWFWESVERLLPEVAALCPPATQEDAENFCDLPAEQPVTIDDWADLRSRVHDAHGYDGDEGNFAQALFKFTHEARMLALQKARGEAVQG